MKAQEVILQARIEGVYGVMRKIQATHNTFETSCDGAGNCCKVGLVLPLLECWNISKFIRKVYWETAESEGYDIAQDWYDTILSNLKAKMHDEDWEPKSNETTTHCAFYRHDFGGCEIYEQRPMVCRSYGVIAPVQEGSCPRKRLPDGRHELIRDETVTRIVAEFDSIVKSWGEQNPELNFSIYMPAGVLKFLLPQEELYELIESTDPKYWMGHEGYQHMLDDSNWQSVEIRSK